MNNNIGFIKLKMYIYFYYWVDELLYIGSTKDYIKRHKEHKYLLNKDFSYPLYRFMNENGLTFDDIFMKIRITDLEDRELLYQYEKELNYEFKPLCNKANTTKWWINKDEYFKEYNEKNKDKRKEWRENNKAKLKKWNEENKDKIKEYMKEYNKKYYQKRKQQNNST